MAVTIGVDPHKASHTAVAIDEHESVLGQLRVRSRPEQLATLNEWAKTWPERTWAAENAAGLGYLLSTARLCRQEGGGRPAQAGGPGPPARQRRRQQERPERRPLCRGCGTSGKTLTGGDERSATPSMARFGGRDRRQSEGAGTSRTTAAGRWGLKGGLRA